MSYDSQCAVSVPSDYSYAVLRLGRVRYEELYIDLLKNTKEGLNHTSAIDDETGKQVGV